MSSTPEVPSQGKHRTFSADEKGRRILAEYEAATSAVERSRAQVTGALDGLTRNPTSMSEATAERPMHPVRDEALRPGSAASRSQALELTAACDHLDL